jgi:hypothetical protein
VTWRWLRPWAWLPGLTEEARQFSVAFGLLHYLLLLFFFSFTVVLLRFELRA